MCIVILIYIFIVCNERNYQSTVINRLSVVYKIVLILEIVQSLHTRVTYNC